MIEHLSWSSMNSYDKDIQNFYIRYVLWEEPIYCPNVRMAMDFGKEYEVSLSNDLYKWRDTQKECEMIIGEYKMYGLFDFFNYELKQVVEVKTRSRWRTEKEIHASWQFRFYNHWCNINWYQFMLHNYNKKEWQWKLLPVNWNDDLFVWDFINKAVQIERFLNWFNIEVKHYKNDI